MNLVTGALAIGFLVGEPRGSWTVLVGALAIWGGVLVLAVVIVEDKS